MQMDDMTQQNAASLVEQAASSGSMRLQGRNRMRGALLSAAGYQNIPACWNGATRSTGQIYFVVNKGEVYENGSSGWLAGILIIEFYTEFCNVDLFGFR